MPTSYSGAYTIPEGIKQIAGGAFFNCSSLTSVTIPNSVTSIGSSAFAWCESLTSVIIPESVTSIGNYAFEGCTGLNNIVCKAPTPPTLGVSNVFNNTNNCPIYVPSQSVEAYKTAANWSEYADRIVGLLNNNQIKYTASRQLTIEDGAGYTDHTFENGVGIVTFNNDLTTLSRQWSIDTFGNPNNYDEGDSSTISIITSLTLPNGVQDIHMGSLLDVADTVYYEGTQKECARISKDLFDGSGAGYYHCFDGIVKDDYVSNIIDLVKSRFGTGLQDLIRDDENALNLLYAVGGVKIDEHSMTGGEFITALVNGAEDTAGLSASGFIVKNHEYNGVTIPVAYHAKSGHFIGIAKAADYEHIGFSDAVFVPVAVNEALDPDYMYVLLGITDEPEPEPEPIMVNITIEHRGDNLETVTLDANQIYAEQGYIGYYSQNTYDSTIDVSADYYLVDNNYPADGDIIYDYCDYLVNVTIEYETMEPEGVRLNPNETYAEQGYSGYYSQNTYNSGADIVEHYLIDNNYPADGEIIYDYCYDTYEPEPEPTYVTVTINHRDGDPEDVELDSDMTYAEQGYIGYYSQNTSMEPAETPDMFFVDGNYPAYGDIIYDYCDDIAR
jgi:hypothetical protein